MEDEIGISHDRIVYILHNELNLHKVCAKWIPRKLSADHKKKRVEISKQLLEVLEKGYNNIITGDETWMYFFTVSSKESNKVWLEIDCRLLGLRKIRKENVLLFLYCGWRNSQNCC